jgi:hypothetical protein
MKHSNEEQLNQQFHKQIEKKHLRGMKFSLTKVALNFLLALW